MRLVTSAECFCSLGRRALVFIDELSTTKIVVRDGLEDLFFIFSMFAANSLFSGELTSSFPGGLKKNLNACIDLLSIPQSGEKMSKRLGGIIDCIYKTSP